MDKFEIKDEFYLEGKKFQILSGAIHYFRIHPSQWEDTLFNLKALGFNTVETYIPWNIHEPYEGRFDFEGIKDIEKFIKTAEKIGLYVILRPTPYICAEWEFGGLPAWLLKDKEIKLRTSDEKFIEKIRNYYKELFIRLVNYQITKGGPVLMMQVENEYGSYGNEKDYLRIIASIMKENGVDVPLFTSDGTWIEALESGALIEDDIFVTGNFGSKSKENCDVLEKFIVDNGKKWPIMCMEYWDGWFNRWGEDIIRRDAIDLAEDVKEMLEIGSINLYMFRGGTNFGFMNGCSARGNNDLPQVTSYDYDGVLTESGDITEKYRRYQEVIRKYAPIPEVTYSTKIEKKAYGTLQYDARVGLFESLDDLSAPVKCKFPTSMERLGQNYGYILYHTKLEKEQNLEKIRLYEANDRANLFVDQKPLVTLYDRQLLSEAKAGEDFAKEDGKPVTFKKGAPLDILVENMGRVNFGPRMEHQRKGIDGHVQINGHTHLNWEEYCLPLDNIEKLDYTKGYTEGLPAFYHFTLDVDQKGDTFLDFEGWGKGCIFLNGFNLGRFWEIGPQKRLYIPAPLLKEGRNEIVVFETDGKQPGTITLKDEPDIG